MREFCVTWPSLGGWVRSGQTPFRLVYRQEAVLSMEFYCVELVHVAVVTDLSDSAHSRGKIVTVVTTRGRLDLS
jgi:hypothetical protein